MVITMKRSTVFLLLASCMNARRALLAVLAVCVLFLDNAAYAIDRSITKTQTPDPVLVISNNAGVGLAFFNLATSDFPSGTLPYPKQLLGVDWKTTYYPQSISESVELCYYRPYSSEKNCVAINPNSSGTLSDFNGEAFNHGSRVTIGHTVLGGVPPYARPAGVDSVTFRYRD